MIDNPQAFPHLEPRNPEVAYCQNGMTLLDYFAGQALAGMMASIADDYAFRISFKEAAPAAYRLARAMLAERSKA